MEKLMIGWQMSTRWTDPTLMLIGIIPYGTASCCVTVTQHTYRQTDRQTHRHTATNTDTHRHTHTHTDTHRDT
jgi:hypothetical protein